MSENSATESMISKITTCAIYKNDIAISQGPDEHKVQTGWSFPTNSSIRNKMNMVFFSLGLILTSKSKMANVHNLKYLNNESVISSYWVSGILIALKPN